MNEGTNNSRFTHEQVRRLSRTIAWIPEDFLSCDDCLEQLEQYAEETMAGRDAAADMPLVAQHLHSCGDCHEELEMLLTAMQSIDAPDSEE